MVDYGSLFVAEKLRLDGSNFVKWYLRLREDLNTHAHLYVLDEPLEECPNVSASYEEYCSAPTPELYSETLCNRSCYTIEGYWVYQSQAKTHWQACLEWIIGTQHPDHAISSDIAFTYN